MQPSLLQSIVTQLVETYGEQRVAEAVLANPEIRRCLWMRLTDTEYSLAVAGLATNAWNSLQR